MNSNGFGVGTEIGLVIKEIEVGNESGLVFNGTRGKN